MAALCWSWHCPSLAVGRILPMPRMQSPSRGWPWAEAGLPLSPVCVLGDASLSRVLPTGVEWRVGLGTPCRWQSQRATPCPMSPAPRPPSLCPGVPVCCRRGAAVPIPVPIPISPFLQASSHTHEDLDLVASCWDHHDNETKTLNAFITHHKFQTKIQVSIFPSCSNTEPGLQGPAGP